MLLEQTLPEGLIEELVWQSPLSLPIGDLPQVEDDPLDPPHRLFFEDTVIGNAIEPVREEVFFVRRCEIPIARYAGLVVVRHQVEDVFLEIGACTTDGVYLALADHFGERLAEFGGAQMAISSKPMPGRPVGNR